MASARSSDKPRKAPESVMIAGPAATGAGKRVKSSAVSRNSSSVSTATTASLATSVRMVA